MKKIILICGVLMISATANACDGISYQSGKFCLSKQRMNWYSAYTWCKDQGMNLIELNRDCGSYSSCSTLKLSADEKEQIISDGGTLAWVWTNNSYSSSQAYIIHLGALDVRYNARNTLAYAANGNCYAMCK